MLIKITRILKRCLMPLALGELKTSCRISQIFRREKGGFMMGAPRKWNMEVQNTF
jgi:hypothetical protein